MNKDTGSSKVQIESLNERISNLKSHFSVHKKDKHSRRGLIGLINKKNKLLKYISKKLNAKK